MKIDKPLLITKLKATGIHLFLSMGIFVYLVYQIYYNWYPQPYFEFDGGWQGMRLIAAVDLVLGPFITFLIFDLRKSRRAILFDLIVIAVIQFGALTYGVYLTYTQRPVAIVLIDDFVVSAITSNYGGRLGSVDDLKQYSDETPPFIYSRLPLDQVALEEINRIKIEDKILEHAQLELYQPQSSVAAALKDRQGFFDQLMAITGARDRFEHWLVQVDKIEEDVLIVLFDGRYGKVWLCFDLEGRYLSYFE